MKAVVGVLVGLAILGAGFGLYRWLSGDEERDRAEAAAEEYSAFGEKKCDAERAQRISTGLWRRAEKQLAELMAECKRPYEVLRIDRISSGFWRFQVRDPVGGSRCIAVDLAQFHVSRESVHVGGTVEGLADTSCGPEWWTPDQATRRLTSSSWARERKAELISCFGEGGSPGRSEYFRRFRCRYSTPNGDAVVVLATSGVDTFELEPGR